MDVRGRGRREFLGLMGAAPEQALAEIRLRSPQLYESVVDVGFGAILARPELGREQRELATVAILAALGGAEQQLALHAGVALRAGLSPSELLALCEHVAGYAGFPRALNAAAVVDQAITDAGLPRPPRMRSVQLSDRETVVAELGETGPAVVLVHALGLDWRMWEPVMPALAAGRRVLAYDLRGHGVAAGSPAPYTMDDTADDLLAVLDALEIEQAHVVGLSFGGGVAQTAVVRRPDRFASLALLATVDQPLDAFEGRARAAEDEGMPAQVAPSLTRWLTPAAIAENGWGVRYARERVLRGDPADWAGAWRAFQSLDVQGRLDTLGRPVLVLAGELDASTTPEIMAGIAERIPGSRYQQLPDTPHMQTLEQPKLVAQALDAFLPSEAAPG
ncbi:alpha/beta hydrolase [Flindersiella endophytica]